MHVGKRVYKKALQKTPIFKKSQETLPPPLVPTASYGPSQIKTRETAMHLCDEWSNYQNWNAVTIIGKSFLLFTKYTRYIPS
jgi:hypothetical protein